MSDPVTFLQIYDRSETFSLSHDSDMSLTVGTGDVEIEIFQNPENADTPETNTSTNLESEISLSYKVIRDIKITPSAMVFSNAYDGKYFKRKLTIQNIGTRLAFIRLCPSNSSAFKFRHFTDGIYLSPGLTIVRNISYTYRATFPVTQGFATLWINDESIDYQFVVTLSAAVISVEPEQLDFGRIDAVNVATRRTLYIKNSGFKGTQFAIDLGRNDLELIVEPMKGIIPAKSQVALAVEIVGAKPGEFIEEIWIKTNPPLRVVITGNFIEPKLMVRRFISGLDFTLLYFKKVYYGSQSTKPLMIKNRSSSSSIFYVMAEIKGETMSLEEARKVDDNYRQFNIVPQDGRLSSEKGSVVLFTFTPNYTPMKNKCYAACFIRVIRMDCRNIAHDALSDQVTLLPEEVENRNSVSSAYSQDPNIFINDGISGEALYEHSIELIHTQGLSFENYIRVCLLGEKEVADISFRPEEFFLNDLTIFKVYERELYIENKSSLLPIIVKYRKYTNIDVDPKEFELKPSGNIEIKIVIRTAKIGTIDSDITFDLYAKDLPEKRNLRKVGFASAKIHYTTKGVQIKERLQKCCLNQTNVCKDLKLKLENEYPYRLKPHELIKKIINDDYYLKYIRGNIAEREKYHQFINASKIPDYDLTNSCLILHQQIACCKHINKTNLKDQAITPFIPLAPRQLYYIKITPKSIRLKKVAAFTSTTDVFSIENKNPFPIRVLLKPSKPCITFFDDGRHIIKSGQKKTITFIFSSSKNGRYNISIEVIINEAAVFEITLIASVVPKTLSLDQYSYHFKDNDESYIFLSLLNGLNAFTGFTWDFPEGCFDIYPKEGTVPAERSLTCMVTLKTDPAYPNVTEGVVTSESGQIKIIQLSYKKKNRAVVFNNDVIDLGLIPLNVCVVKTLVMKNIKKFSIIYRISNAKPMPGIIVTPECGRLDGKMSQNFKITVQMNAVIQFSTKITFIIDDKDVYEVEISGLIDYPRVSMKPDVLYFRKIAPFSFDRLAFKIKNLSKLECFIRFQLEDFPEFTVTKSEDSPTPEIESVILQPQEAQILFLHCHPFHVCTYSFFLPFSINDILGPSTLVSTTSAFLEQYEVVYEKIPNVTVIKKIPSVLPTVRVNCCAIDKHVEFSDLDLEFVFYKENHYGNIDKKDFEIFSCCNDTIKICIRTDDLKPPFSIRPQDDYSEKLEYYDVSFVVTLEPGESFVFKIDFQPYEYGKYVIRLPIFLRHYIDDKIFNYLTLTGEFKTPEMVPSERIFYLEPVIYSVKNEIDFHLNMGNHFEHCQLLCRSEINGLFVIFHYSGFRACGKKQLPCTLCYIPVKNTSVDHKVTISCTCKSSCEIHVKSVVENTLLVTNVFLHLLKLEHGPEKMNSLKNCDDDESDISSTSIAPPRFLHTFANKNLTCYPFFPKDDDESPYGKYMRNVLESIENWLFTQIFRKKGYYRIPENFTDFCTDPDSSDKAHLKKKTYDLPLVEVILKLAGNKIKKDIITSECDLEDEANIMAYTYTTYSNILRLLRNHDALLPTVSAKILLNYQQYLLYYKTRGKRENFEFKDEKTFYRYSKQCWIDLFLQILKIFILRRIEMPISLQRKSLKPSSSLDIAQNEDCGYEFSIYGRHEKFLRGWLLTHFAEQRSILWKEEVADREINFFDEDLKDGLILGAVTAAHCPYMKHYIEDMFTKPKTPEENFHNACKLVQTWKLMKFSYELSPHRIANPTMLEMLLLVAYLYDVLPSCLPRETLEIRTLLSERRKIEIEVQNCGSSPSLYEPIFFGNERNLFEVQQPNLKVPPGKRRNFVVLYHAKSFDSVSAYLLLSGESGNRFAKNIAVKLVGIPDISMPFKEIPIKLPFYKVCEVTIDIESPFQKEAEYGLNILHTSLTTDERKIYPWQEIFSIRAIQEFLLDYEIAKFDSTGKRTAKPIICLMKPGIRDFWIFYNNTETGDFAIKLQGIPKITPDCYEDIEVILPKKYFTNKCTCKKSNSSNFNTTCPQVIWIDIPNTNHKLWVARKNVLLKCVTDEEELRFWKNRLFTPWGTRILALILNSETHALRQPVQENVTYNVLSEKDAIFRTLKSFEIKDIISEGCSEFPIHPVKDLVDQSCNLRMVSIDKQERRFYRIIFKRSASTLNLNSERTE